MDFRSPEFQDAIQRLNDCLTKENLEKIKVVAENAKKYSEDEIVTWLGLHIVKKLSGTVHTSKTKQKKLCPCGCHGKLDDGKMYIGTENTWHGELDLLSGRQANLVAVTAATDFGDTSAATNDDVDNDDDDNAGNKSPGDGTNIEVKTDLALSGSKICHVLAQSIVFGWTEFNRHQNYSPYIPSLLMDKQHFLIIVYNPKEDSLMTSKHTIKFYPFDDDFSGIIIIWLVLNHRLFFQKTSNFAEEAAVACGFRSQMVQKSTIQDYEILATYQTCVKCKPTVQYTCDPGPVFSLGLKRKMSFD